MHHCFNVVCGQTGDPAAVLIRALEPRDGVERMRRRHRSGSTGTEPMHRLLAGPGKLCRVFEIDRSLDGTDLTGSAVLYIERSERRIAAAAIVTTPRVGISDRGAWTDAPLRFLLSKTPAVSVPAAKAGRARRMM
jgi:DNA-3-methyladenine glycosylase